MEASTIKGHRGRFCSSKEIIRSLYYFLLVSQKNRKSVFRVQTEKQDKKKHVRCHLLELLSCMIGILNEKTTGSREMIIAFVIKREIDKVISVPTRSRWISVQGCVLTVTHKLICAKKKLFSINDFENHFQARGL
jgi:hypothetical protein